MASSGDSHLYENLAHENAALQSTMDRMSKVLDNAARRSEETLQVSTTPRSRSTTPRSRLHSRTRTPSPRGKTWSGQTSSNIQELQGNAPPTGYGLATSRTSRKDILEDTKDQGNGRSELDDTTKHVGQTKQRSKTGQNSGRTTDNSYLKTILQYGASEKPDWATMSDKEYGKVQKGTLSDIILQYGSKAPEGPKPIKALQETSNAGELFEEHTYETIRAAHGTKQKTLSEPKKRDYANVVMQYGSKPAAKLDPKPLVETFNSATKELRSSSGRPTIKDGSRPSGDIYTRYEDAYDSMEDTVHRLNSVLAEYQQKYPPIGLSSQTGVSGPQADIPWVSDRTLMSPLFTEYESSLNIMKEQLGKYQNEQRELRLQVDKLVAENTRLNKELKESVEIQMTSLPNVTSTGDPEDKDSMVEEKVLQNLQHQLQMALQEKDSAMEMWQTSVNEVDRLEKSVQNQQFNPRLQALEHQASQIKEQYIKTVAELNNEIQTLQQELTLSKNELKISQNQTNALRKTLDQLRKQMSIQEHEKTEVEDGKLQIHAQSAVMQRKAISTETKLKQTEIDLNQYKHDNAALEQKIQDLQKKCSLNEDKAYKAAMKLRDKLQAAESAVLEKEQALMREKQSAQEIVRLQEALSSLVDQAGLRTRQEVDSVRQQCNKNIDKLMEEIHNLELDNSEKQSQIDRAVREKRAAESELEKIYKEGLIQGHKDSASYDDLNRRACDAERTRDEALVKMDAVHSEMKRMDMTLKREKNQLLAEAEQLKDRLTMMDNEFELANNDRVRLTEKIDELQRKMVKVQQEKDAAERNYTKEVTCLTKDQTLKQKEYEVRLQTMEDNHRSGMMELRQMLSSQQRMSAKWKEECQTITSKFEAKVRDLRDEVKREKQRNMEVTKLLKDSRDKTLEVENMLSEYTRNIKRMEERVRESESRAATAAMQASRSHRLDHDIVEERRHLQRELERTLRESRISQGSYPDPLTTADLQPGHLNTAPYTNGTAAQDALEEITAR